MSKDETYIELLECQEGYRLKIVDQMIGSIAEKVPDVLTREENVIETINENIKRLHESIEGIKRLEECLSEIKQQKIETQSAENVQLKKKCEDQRSFNMKLQAEIQTAIDEQTHTRAKLEGLQDVCDSAKILKAEQNCRLCDEYLGLEIVTLKGDRMQFLFKNMIRHKPDVFAFVILRLEDKKVYRITESFPEIDELKTLEHALNRTNNLAAFIRTARKLLKEKC